LALSKESLQIALSSSLVAHANVANDKKRIRGRRFLIVVIVLTVGDLLKIKWLNGREV
jgi:hypothetical protein